MKTTETKARSGAHPTAADPVSHPKRKKRKTKKGKTNGRRVASANAKRLQQPNTPKDSAQTVQKSLFQRFSQACSAVRYLTLPNLDRQLNRLAHHVFTSITGGSLEECSKPRALLAFAATTPLSLAIKANQLVMEEVLSWADATNFADHLQLLGCNPIPEYYYVQGDCFRFSSAITGHQQVRPYANSDDILSIKGRFGVLMALYALLGLRQ